MAKTYIITPAKRTTDKDCAFCRNSETRIVKKRPVIECRIGGNGDAVNCKDFKDARKPSAAPYIPEAR